MFYRLGRLTLTVEGDSPAVDCIRGELAALAGPRDPGEPRVRFRFGTVLPELPANAERLGGLRVFDAGYAASYPRTDYALVRTPNGLAIDLRLREPSIAAARIAPDWLYRAQNWNHLARPELCAKDFFYELFDFVTQAEQLALGQSYLHASTMEKGGRALALVAWGGIGKTSTMLRLVLGEGFRYLSDDLALVDEAGVVWRSPKKLQIYGYNLIGDERLAVRLLGGRSLLDRAAWYYHRRKRGEAGVRRRVSAEELLGAENMAASTPLGMAVFLRRVGGGGIEVRPVAPDDLARWAASTLLRELEPYPSISAALGSARAVPALPLLPEVLERSEHVLRQACSRAACYEMLLPPDATPEVVERALLQHLESAW